MRYSESYLSLPNNGKISWSERTDVPTNQTAGLRRAQNLSVCFPANKIIRDNKFDYLPSFFTDLVRQRNIWNTDPMHLPISSIISIAVRRTSIRTSSSMVFVIWRALSLIANTESVALNARLPNSTAKYVERVHSWVEAKISCNASFENSIIGFVVVKDSSIMGQCRHYLSFDAIV